MKKSTRKKASAKRTPPPRHAKHAGAKHPRSQQNKASVTLDADGKLTFNHAMVYVKDVERGLASTEICWDSSSSKTSAMRISRCMRACAHRAATVRSHYTRRVRKFPF